MHMLIGSNNRSKSKTVAEIWKQNLRKCPSITYMKVCLEQVCIHISNFEKHDSYNTIRYGTKINSSTSASLHTYNKLVRMWNIELKNSLLKTLVLSILYQSANVCICISCTQPLKIYATCIFTKPLSLKQPTYNNTLSCSYSVVGWQLSFEPYMWQQSSRSTHILISLQVLLFWSLQTRVWRI